MWIRNQSGSHHIYYADNDIHLENRVEGFTIVAHRHLTGEQVVLGFYTTYARAKAVLEDLYDRHHHIPTYDMPWN